MVGTGLGASIGSMVAVDSLAEVGTLSRCDFAPK